MSTPVVIGFEEDMERTGRDYGRDAMLRQLGALAKRRREELGLGRPAFAKQAGIGSDRTIYDFETSNKVPQPMTVVRLEKALGWRRGVIAELLEDTKRKASSVQMEDVDEWDTTPVTPLAQIPTPDLLRELAARLETLQAGMGGAVLPKDLGSKDLYGMAASGHIPEHLEKEFEDAKPDSDEGPTAN